MFVKDPEAVAEAKKYAADNKVDLRLVELYVVDEDSVKAAIAHIIQEAGRLDIIVHNAGHMIYGPAEAFTVKQSMQLYDVNVMGT